MANEKYPLSGLSTLRRVVVRKGDPNIHGGTPSPGNVPVGPAPPDVRQVISTFDSRPIGAYDFVLSDMFTTYAERPVAEVQSAPGFITIVRRIEVEAVDGVILQENQRWSFSANGVAATAWDYRAGRLLSSWGVDTFFVVAPNVPMRLTALNGWPGESNVESNVIVRFIGNLLLDSNEQPSAQVGTPPHSVRIDKS